MYVCMYVCSPNAKGSVASCERNPEGLRREGRNGERKGERREERPHSGDNQSTASTSKKSTKSSSGRPVRATSGPIEGCKLDDAKQCHQATGRHRRPVVDVWATTAQEAWATGPSHATRFLICRLAVAKRSLRQIKFSGRSIRTRETSGRPAMAKQSRRERNHPGRAIRQKRQRAGLQWPSRAAEKAIIQAEPSDKRGHVQACNGQGEPQRK